MKLAIVYDAIYPDVIGGGEKRNWEIARRLAAAGHDVWLVGLQHWSGGAIVRREGVTCAGVGRPARLYNQKGGRTFWEPLYFAYRLFVFLRGNRFDVIDCAGFPYLSCIVAWFFSALRKMPLVITWYEVRGTRAWVSYSGWPGIVAGMFEAMVARLTDHNVGISPLTLDRARELFPGLGSKMTLIPCGVDARSTDCDSRTRNRSQLLSVGRLAKHKRTDWLIRCAAELVPEHPEIRVVVIGEGSEKNALLKLAEESGIGERVEFRGFVDEREMLDAMACSGILVFPSLQEGFGIVALEAMAEGAAVVGARSPMSAIPCLVRHDQNGMLFDTYEEMVEYVRKLLRDAGERDRLASAGRRTAAEYDWDSVVIPEIERYYAEMIS